MSEEVAAIAFAGYFRRWQEIENGKQKLSDESKDLFGDMKAAGYDSKATRAVFRDKRKELNADPAEVQEKEAIYDLYMDALNRGLTKAPARPAPAHVEKIEEFAAAKGAANATPDADIRATGRGVHSMHPLRDQPETADGETSMVLGTGRERPLSIGLHTDGDPEARFETASLHQSNSPGMASEATDHSANGANAGEGHVDSSALRASSAVQFGATNSPDGAHRTMSMTPLEPREANGLKGFGFTVTFDDQNSSQDAETVTPPVQAKPAPAESMGDEISATNSHLSAHSSRQANTAGAVESPPTAPAPPPTHKDGCLDQSGCKVKFTSALCSRCASERAKTRVAA